MALALLLSIATCQLILPLFTALRCRSGLLQRRLLLPRQRRHHQPAGSSARHAARRAAQPAHGSILCGRGVCAVPGRLLQGESRGRCRGFGGVYDCSLTAACTLAVLTHQLPSLTHHPAYSLC